MSAITERLTPPMVRWAYRFLLGRDAEEESVIEEWCDRAGGLHDLREGILLSPEMTAVALSGFPVRGGWIDNKPTEEAARICLMLRDGKAPETQAVEALRLRYLTLRSLRQFLLTSPSIEDRLPLLDGPRSRTLDLLGQEFSLKGDSREPEFITAPGMAPRLAALARAAWPDGGQGRVLVEAGAGIGVGSLGLAAGAPGHAMLIAHEASLRRAAALAENLSGNELSRAQSRAIAMGSPDAMMEREGLQRLDLLRMNEAGAARFLPELAPWLLARGTLVWASFDLGELLTERGPGPRDVLAAWLQAFPHVIAFDAAHEPLPLLDEVELNAALYRTLLRPDRRDEFLLCADLDWLDRYATI